MGKSGIITIGLSLLLAGVMSTGCKSKAPETPADDKVLLEIGDSALTVRDVVRLIPAGMTVEDSIEMFNSLTERWMRTMMLSELAQENVTDLARINRMAEDYRNSLIIDRYLRAKQEESGEVSDQSIKSYYAEHGSEMKLEAPLVKGVYLKISESEEKIGDIRKWIASAKPKDIDNIEKNGLRHASQYEYFEDRWIDWNDVAEQIPYRFYDADAFLKSTKDFETTYGGSTYLLHISHYIPSGEVMPYDYAKGKIREMLMREKKSDYRQQLLKSLYRKGIEDGTLKPGLYDPYSGKVKETAEISSPNNVK